MRCDNESRALALVEPDESTADTAAWGGSAGGGTILVVDDDYFVRDVTVKMLKKAGFEVLEAASGEQALESCRNNGGRIDLVLLDMCMPGMGGAACLEEMRRRYDELRIIVSSGHAQELEMVDGDLLDVPCLFKPYPMSDLVGAVRAELGRAL